MLKEKRILMKKIVYLVNAGNDESMASIANDYSFPPLNILALGTWLKNRVPNIEILCRDSGILGLENTLNEIKKVKPWLVGIGVLATSYQTALDIAKYSKSFGSFTVFGNDQSAHLSKNILKNRPYVDYVIGAEYGEYPLEMLVRYLAFDEGEINKIPTLTYRDMDKNVLGFEFEKDKTKLSIVNYPFEKTKDRKIALDEFPIVDRNLYPKFMWEEYLKNYMASFGHLHGDRVPKGVTTMNRARGCNRANENIKCKHCDMILDVSFSSADVFWEEVKTANRQVGADVFYEVCDSLTSFPKFIEKVHEMKPKDLDFDPLFFVYGQALDIVRSPKIPKMLKEIGVYKMNIGLESGCNITLKNMKGQKDSVETNYAALKTMKENGIAIYGSFVLGTELETEQTLTTTVNWIKKIIDENLIHDVEAQPILPLPNNYYGKILFPESEKYNKESDWPVDIDEVSREYINKYSGVSYERCIEAVNEIRDHASNRKINFGSGVSKKENYE